jgi:molybdenum cofactor biosynthesis protein MoaC
MNDITAKIRSLRIAQAEATVSLSLNETVDAIKENRVPKGNVFEFARAAALLAVKNTPNVIPDCHPLPIESCTVNSELIDKTIRITVEVKAIYRTGVEVEAMHGASIAALTMYDMLKPIDKGIEILNIKLLHKKGGKSDFSALPNRDIFASVIVCSDSISAGKKEDKAGKKIIAKLEKIGVKIADYKIISDDADAIKSETLNAANNTIDLLIFTGGTGLSPRDVTPESIEPLLHRKIPGIMEAARNYGQERMPWAMVSRGIAGYRNNTLILTLPGSTRGAEETMDALFPYILHLLKVTEGAQH